MDSSLIRTWGCQSGGYRAASRFLMDRLAAGDPFVLYDAFTVVFQLRFPLWWEIARDAYIANYNVNVVTIEVDGDDLSVILPYPAWVFEAHAKWPFSGSSPAARSCYEVNFPFG